MAEEEEIYIEKNLSNPILDVSNEYNNIDNDVPLGLSQKMIPNTGKESATPILNQERNDIRNSESNLKSSSHSKSGSAAQLEYTKTVNNIRLLNQGFQNVTIDLEVRNLIIVTKLKDIFLYYLTRELVEWIIVNFPKIDIYVESVLENDAKFNAADICKDCNCGESRIKYWTQDFVENNDLFFDLVITMGGDGTVLFVSTLFQKHVPPVLSFSLGSLGFLTNFKFENYKKDLPRILNNEIKSNLRMRMECKVFKSKKNGKNTTVDNLIQIPKKPIDPHTNKKVNVVELISVHQVLNEVTVDRGPSPFITNLEIYSNEFFMTTAQGDGLIIATPTGSTAYSLSAGGSLVCPTVNAIAITPICPHTLSFRPIIMPDSILLKIKVSKNSRSSAWASFDGKNRVELCPGDIVTITCSPFSFPTVDSTDEEFIKNISRTLNWNRREQQKSFSDLLSSKNKVKFETEIHKSEISLGSGSSLSEVDIEEDNVSEDYSDYKV